MTADIKLLPLYAELQGHPKLEIIKHYARANVAHATEALRAEVEAWRELSDHVRAGACNAIWPDRYTDARTRDVAAALKRAERLAEALREAKRLGDQGDWRAEREVICTALRKYDQEVGNG